MPKKEPRLAETSLVNFFLQEFLNQHTHINSLRGSAFQLVQFYFSIAGLFIGVMTILSKFMDNSYLGYFKYSFLLFFILFLFGHSIYEALRDIIRDCLTIDTAIFFVRAFFGEKGGIEPYLLYYHGPFKESNFKLGEWENHKDSVVYLTQFTGIFNIIILLAGIGSLGWALFDAISNFKIFILLVFGAIIFLAVLISVYKLYNHHFYRKFIRASEASLDPIRKALWVKVEDDLK